MTDPKPEWPDDDRGVEYDMTIPPGSRLCFPAGYWDPLPKCWIEACKPLLDKIDLMYGSPPGCIRQGPAIGFDEPTEEETRGG